MGKTISHLKVVLKHKHEVFKAMAACGHPIQGMIHDMSKLSPVEFIQIQKED